MGEFTFRAYCLLWVLVHLGIFACFAPL
jgi:hypothetical protein